MRNSIAIFLVSSLSVDAVLILAFGSDLSGLMALRCDRPVGSFTAVVWFTAIAFPGDAVCEGGGASDTSCIGWCRCAGLACTELMLVVCFCSDSSLLCLGSFWAPRSSSPGVPPCNVIQYMINSICFLYDSWTTGHLRGDGNTYSHTLTRSDLLAG